MNAVDSRLESVRIEHLQVGVLHFDPCFVRCDAKNVRITMSGHELAQPLPRNAELELVNNKLHQNANGDWSPIRPLFSNEVFDDGECVADVAGPSGVSEPFFSSVRDSTA